MQLQAALEQSHLGWGFPSISVPITKKGIEEKERTQRTRGFLYSAVGVAVANCFDLKDVILADNGVVSVNLPLNGQTIDTKMSRTTHPKFQWYMNRLFDLVSPGVHIRNPLLFKTRAETLDILKTQGLEALLRISLSCAATRGLPAATPHCGTCSQCVDRRIGVVAASLEDYDSPYAIDIATADLNETAVTLVESYVRLTRELRGKATNDVLVSYPEVIDCANATSADEFQQVVDMLVRQADYAQMAFEVLGQRHVSTLMAGELPATCLTSLAAVSKPTPRAGKWRKPLWRTVELNPTEVAEFSAARFKSRLAVTVPGERSRRASNAIEIDGKRLELADADFILLLRLIVELGRTPDGYVRKGGSRKPGGLADEPGIVPDGIEQAISRLRRGLAPVLGDVGDKGFIETNHGRIRLSTHLRYIDCNVNALADHSNEMVRRLATDLKMAGVSPAASSPV